MLDPKLKKEFAKKIGPLGYSLSHHLGPYDDTVERHAIDISPKGLHDDNERIAVVRAALANPNVSVVIIPSQSRGYDGGPLEPAWADPKNFEGCDPDGKLSNRVGSEKAIHVEVTTAGELLAPDIAPRHDLSTSDSHSNNIHFGSGHQSASDFHSPSPIQGHRNDYNELHYPSGSSKGGQFAPRRAAPLLHAANRPPGVHTQGKRRPRRLPETTKPRAAEPVTAPQEATPWIPWTPLSPTPFKELNFSIQGLDFPKETSAPADYRPVADIDDIDAATFTASLPPAAAPYGHFILIAARAYHVNPFVLAAIVARESDFGTSALLHPRGPEGIGASKDLGLAQINPRFWDHFRKVLGFGPDDWKDPLKNLVTAAYLLADNLGRSRGDYKKALAAYNAGYKKVSRLRPDVLPDSVTQHHNYGHDVMNRAYAYKHNAELVAAARR